MLVFSKADDGAIPSALLLCAGSGSHHGFALGDKASSSKPGDGGLPGPAFEILTCGVRLSYLGCRSYTHDLQQQLPEAGFGAG